jgi:phage terminase large subunit-like protein
MTRSSIEKSLDRATEAFADWADDTEVGMAHRQAVMSVDPLLFAIYYLPHHLTGPETNEKITLSEAHLDWIELGKTWIHPASTSPAFERDAFIAPRGMGKSTWFFLILPLWAAAFGHAKFIAAFADSATQAEGHLSSFAEELIRNDALRRDYPTLCAPLLGRRGQPVADNNSQYQAASGFVFMARGIDAGSLGMKVGDKRPDLMILDDIEPGEASYSEDQAKKRLSTLQDVVLPLNVFARVVIVGTVTMPGSIIHQIVRVTRGETLTKEELDKYEWIDKENIVGHYYPAIATKASGKERSTWPEKWPLAFLRSIRGTRTYAKNYANDPMGFDGDYWHDDDFVHGHLPVVRSLLSIDPAVTSKKSSDETGFAVIGFNPMLRKCHVREAFGARLSPKAIKRRALAILTTDQSIGAVLIETNQGGDTWKEILKGLPVPIFVVHQSEPKEVRAANVLNLYQRGDVIHSPALAGGTAESQMVSFPKAPHDDIVDAIDSGVAFFMLRKKKRKASAQSVEY